MGKLLIKHINMIRLLRHTNSMEHFNKVQWYELHAFKGDNERVRR